VTPQVTIYTDGACKGNPGRGGWGAILIMGDHRKEMHGGEALTTNNRMELMGAIAALEALTKLTVPSSRPQISELPPPPPISVPAPTSPLPHPNVTSHNNPPPPTHPPPTLDPALPPKHPPHLLPPIQQTPTLLLT
jgi:hypothetical protein